MLIRFSVENWMSFRGIATLSMLATRERQHSEHIKELKKYDLKLLPVAMIYGGNASGKSNLIKALRFAQRLITTTAKPESTIAVRSFRLAKDFNRRPTKFHFEILIDSNIYDYKFSVTSTAIIDEELSRVTATSRELLFRRGPGHFTLSRKVDQRNNQLFAFHGTHDNQLFLNNSVSQKLEAFRPIRDWFEETLILIDPDTYYGGLFDITNENHPRFSSFTARLRDLDSGIFSLRHIDIAPETILPKELLNELAAGFDDGQPLPNPLESEGTLLRKEKGRIVARQLSLIHRAASGENVPFTFADESDGTRRLLNLLPAFLFLEEKNQSFVVVIDELDRSLHSLLTKELLRQYLGLDSRARSTQLIFTTHDTTLMDQDIFRRDEIWLTERDKFGVSRLVALSEYKDVRNDKDIRKSYLRGRMGGIPKIKAIGPVHEVQSGKR